MADEVQSEPQSPTGDGIAEAAQALLEATALAEKARALAEADTDGWIDKGGDDANVRAAVAEIEAQREPDRPSDPTASMNAREPIPALLCDRTGTRRRSQQVMPSRSTERAAAASLVRCRAALRLAAVASPVR
jgi:hypothetical protein